MERAKYNEIYIIKKECINTNTKDIENVLILQGGGSLGAFACGVFKTFAKKKFIKFHIISGISIGAINGAIAAGSKSDNPIKDLDDFFARQLKPKTLTIGYRILNSLLLIIFLNMIYSCEYCLYYSRPCILILIFVYS